MDKSTYMELLASRPEVLSLTDEQIKSWVDQICHAINELEDSLYELQYGKYNKYTERYEHNIAVCGINCSMTKFPEVQIYKGIDVMARATKSELFVMYDPDIQFPYRYSFKYRGIKFYQLETEEIREEQA